MSLWHWKISTRQPIAPIEQIDVNKITPKSLREIALKAQQEKEDREKLSDIQLEQLYNRFLIAAKEDAKHGWTYIDLWRDKRFTNLTYSQVTQLINFLVTKGFRKSETRGTIYWS